ncbi:wax ester/triacylglycerol synthase domain-containing protein [Streptomyces ziwulingensis]
MDTPRHTSSPLDNWLVRAGATTGFVLDFHGTLRDPDLLIRRTLHRAAALPALRHVPPAPRSRHWTTRKEPLGPDPHVRHHVLARHADLHMVTGDLLRLPLPDGPHPPWAVWIVTDAHHQRFRVCYRVHHGLQDGASAAHTALTLIADQHTPGPHPYQPARPTLVGALLTVRGFLGNLRHERHWPRLPVQLPNSIDWVYEELPEERLRRLGNAWNATVNDVCLAAIAQAMREWRASSRSCPDLPVIMPMTLRQKHEPYAAGNRITAQRLLLPCSAASFGEALHAVRRQTDALRIHRARDAARWAMAALPRRLGEQSCTRMLDAQAAPVTTSSITLPQTPTCHGVPLHGASMLNTPHTGCPTYISFTRAAGTVRCTAIHGSSLTDMPSITRAWARVIDQQRIH